MLFGRAFVMANLDVTKAYVKFSTASIVSLRVMTVSGLESTCNRFVDVMFHSTCSLCHGLVFLTDSDTRVAPSTAHSLNFAKSSVLQNIMNSVLFSQTLIKFLSIQSLTS